MPIQLALAILLLSLVFGSPVRAGESERIARSNEALALEAHGDPLGALSLATAELARLCAETRDPGERESAAAHAEFAVVLVSRLTRATTSFSATARALDTLERKGLPPLLDARILAARAECALHLGDLATLQRATRDLGFVSDWMAIGPFDNERGGGFSRAEDPEKGFDAELVARGKERDVRWRALPAKNPPLGIVELGEMFRPREQAFAYLRTTIALARTETVVFRLGSGGSLRFWVDGKLVCDAKVRRPYRGDQNVVAVALAAGSHELLAKVCVQEEAWRFSCRVTRPDGSPATDLACEPAGVASANAEVPADSTPLAPGALEHFARLAGFRLPEAAARSGEAEPKAAAANDAERAAAAYRYTTLLRERRAEDDTDHPDRPPAALAFELDPKNPAHGVLLGLALRQETQIAEERELNPSRRAFEKAYEADPKNVQACLELAEHYTSSLPIPEEAKKWLDRALAAAPGSLAGRLRRAARFASLDLPREAERELREASKGAGADGSAPLQEQLGILEYRRGRGAEAERRLRAAFALTRFGDGTGTTLRNLLVQQGRAAEALAILEAQARLQPFATWIPAERARLLAALDRGADASAAFAEAIAIAPDDARLPARLASLRALLGDRDGAVRALEKAVELDPKDRTSRRYLEFLRSSVKPFEDPFRVDAAELVGKGERIAAADEPFEALLWQVAYRLNPDGTTQRYEHLVATILNEEGAKQLDGYGVQFDPSDEIVRIRRARVLRKDGAIDDAPAPPGTSYVKFPPLAIGDTIDVEARIDTVRVGVFGNYFGVRHLFNAFGFASTRRSEQIYVAATDQKLHFHPRNGAPGPEKSEDPEGKITTYRFRMDGLRKPELEGSMPSPLEFAPSLSASTYGAWEEFTAWWWNLIEKECQSSPAIREKVAELIAGKPTREEKMRAIYDFVVTDVRYNAWEFGVHGYKPYNAATIFDRRYGDCKDKAILIKTMLADAGIEAHPVLIFADVPRPKEDLTLPMVGLFNHCIAWAPPGDGMPAMFLDGTARSHPMGVLPDMDYGARVVIVREGKPVLADVGYPPPEFNVDSIELSLELQADGSARGSLVFRPKGNGDVRFREIFGSEQGAQRENLERMLSPELGRTKVTELTTSDLADLSKPVELRATIEVEKLAKAKGNDLALPMTFHKRKLLGFADEPKRTYDLLVGTPEADDVALQYVLPSGLAVRAIPPDASQESPFGEFSIETSREGSAIRVRARSSTKRPRVTPEEYEAFRQFARDLDEAQDREIVLRSER